MLALCSMLLPPYYAHNYTGIIGSNLDLITGIFSICNDIICVYLMFLLLYLSDLSMTRFLNIQYCKTEL